MKNLMSSFFRACLALALLAALLCFAQCKNDDDNGGTTPGPTDEAYVALVCDGRGSSDSRFECGSGTMVDPFVIANLAQLIELQSDNTLWDSSKYFDVVLNLDLGSIANWQPIGNTTTQFQGTFRGLRPNDQPVQISNLRINQPFVSDPANDNLGFFGYTNGATIENVGMENVDVTGYEYLGGLVGRSDGATINNCYAAGAIAGNHNIGGLLGRGQSGTTEIDNSYSTVGVTATGNNIGGLVGRSETGVNTINNSYATGTVMGTGSDTGGLVGYNNNGSTISNSYATGTVMVTLVSSAPNNIGGLVGHNNNGSTISNSYATGTVRTIGTTSSIGGLVGYNNNGSTISNSYATGTVMGNNNVGGLVGFNSSVATITGTNYFVNDVGGGNGIGDGSCAGTCSRQGVGAAPASLENGLDETLDSGLNWDSAMDANGDPVWNNLNQPGFPCIATITFGRGGCPP